MDILLADDHLLFVEGLCAILATESPHNKIECVHTGLDALLKLSKSNFDIALIDLRLPEMDGFTLLSELKKINCLTPTVIVSASEDPEDIIQAIKLGSMGFVPKSASGQQIIQSINQILDGNIIYPGIDTDETINHKYDWAAQHNISSRQLEVLRLMRKGLSNHEIATHLHLSLSTVKTHIAAIFNSLSTKSRTEAVKIAHHLGLD